MKTGAAVEAVGLTKEYRSRSAAGGTVRAVDGLNLSVGAGEFFSLLGVNGAGKTTTVRMLSCLTPPTAGTATVGGCDIRREPEAVRQMSNVSPQSTAVAPNLTVQENLAFMAGLWGADTARARRAAEDIMQRMGLTDRRCAYARTLSGGWQRRLSIAMALITNPRVLFLDEPTLGLDVLARRELWSVISSLRGQVTLILTTHYLEEAAALSDRIGIMADGRLRALGTAAGLCAQAGRETFEDAFVALATGGKEGA